MQMSKDFMKDNDLGLLVLRLSTGGLMLFHGVSKLINGVGPIGEMLAALGLPSFIAYGSLLVELVAALIMVLGLWTRAAAVAMVFNMIVAILMAHTSVIFSLTPQGGWAIELPMLYLLPALALVFTGGGRYALTRNNIFS
jgi:putative oxidoreductase